MLHRLSVLHDGDALVDRENSTAIIRFYSSDSKCLMYAVLENDSLLCVRKKASTVYKKSGVDFSFNSYRAEEVRNYRSVASPEAIAVLEKVESSGSLYTESFYDLNKFETGGILTYESDSISENPGIFSPGYFFQIIRRFKSVLSFE